MIKIVLTVSFVFCFLNTGIAQKNYAALVNPFIGTGGHGHTYPGATLPHGMIQLSPDTRLEGWDGCGGYHYSDSFVYGFSHTHLSGTGVSDYGDILVMPMHGTPSPDNKKYGSAFTHNKEKASAGYYSVFLEDDKIEAELTTSLRVGMHHYKFSTATDNNIIIDLTHRDEVLESSLQIIDSVTITGLRRSKAWATNQYVFFVMKFSSAITKSGIWEKDVAIDRNIKSSKANNIKAWLQFQLPATGDLYVKVAISGVSIEGAIKNMQAEMPGWSFNAIRTAAENTWNKELSRIEVESNDTEKLKIFYTALYHTAIVPNINMDVDSLYRGRDNMIHKAVGFTNYSVFSLWDTYRAAHPLYTIIDQKRTIDYIKTFLVQYQQGGRLPVWELASNETDCMIGYHSVPVIVDAYVKGIRGFNTKLAMEAMQKSAEWNHLGLPAYRKTGMIEVDDEHESVSKALEYAYDDFCISMFASLTGNKDVYKTFSKRAQYYKNMLDPGGFMRPRKNGDWLKPFDPREVNNHFTEANSWQYSFYFPQDIGGYLNLRGGVKHLESKLDSLFRAPSQTTGRDQSDITGLIGQYAHGNEPSHHIAYLYNYVGKAHKTQALVRKIMLEMYKNSPDGLIGNEDCGQMSAWYVFGAMGFYPVTPGLNHYIMGAPLFPSIKVNLENGKVFQISAKNVSDSDSYVQQASLFDGDMRGDHFKSNTVLYHSTIMSGGKLNFVMGNKPTSFFSVNYPKVEINDAEEDIKLELNPVINGGGVPFKGTKTVTISAGAGSKIYYSLDGSEPGKSSTLYTKPINVDRSLTIKAKAIRNGNESFVTTAIYKKLLHNWSVQLLTPFEKQYDGGGSDGLVDGIRGVTDWRKGNWQGYQLTDPHIIIDLKKQQQISSVNIGFLQDTRAWIVMPSRVTVELSDDNKNFRQVYEGKQFLPIEDLNTQLVPVNAVFKAQKARFVRIKATQYGKLPSWHEGVGGDTHIFIDEIIIK